MFLFGQSSIKDRKTAEAIRCYPTYNKYLEILSNWFCI